jgi:hypothetical protein
LSPAKKIAKLLILVLKLSLYTTQYMVAKQRNFNAAEDNITETRKHYVTAAFDSFLAKDSIEHWTARARNSIQWRDLQWWRSGQK